MRLRRHDEDCGSPAAPLVLSLTKSHPEQPEKRTSACNGDSQTFTYAPFFYPATAVAVALGPLIFVAVTIAAITDPTPPNLAAVVVVAAGGWFLTIFGLWWTSARVTITGTIIRHSRLVPGRWTVPRARRIEVDLRDVAAARGQGLPARIPFQRTELRLVDGSVVMLPLPLPGVPVDRWVLPDAEAVISACTEGCGDRNRLEGLFSTKTRRRIPGTFPPVEV